MRDVVDVVRMNIDGPSMSDNTDFDTLARQDKSQRWLRSQDLDALPQGRIAITIHADGRWSYRGSDFGRLEMVQLFAQCLILREQEYFLIAPEQLLKITVEDLPFIVTGAVWNLKRTILTLKSNLGDCVDIGPEHPLQLAKLPGNEEQLIPCIEIRGGLRARLSRSCFYQLVDWSKEVKINGRTALQISSGGIEHLLGYID